MMALLGKALFYLVLLQEQTTIYQQFKLVVVHTQARYPHLLMAIHGATVFQQVLELFGWSKQDLDKVM